MCYYSTFSQFAKDGVVSKSAASYTTMNFIVDLLVNNVFIALNILFGNDLLLVIII